MSRVDQEAVATFAEVLSTAGVSYHQQSRQATTDRHPVAVISPGGRIRLMSARGAVSFLREAHPRYKKK